MDILVCIKRVPATAGQITLTADGQEIDTRYLGFTISPHEECAVEEAVRLTERHGGTSTVLSLGPEAAIDQLRDAMALGIERGMLLEADGREWDPVATAAAIVESIEAERAAGRTYDLVLFGKDPAQAAGAGRPHRRDPRHQRRCGCAGGRALATAGVGVTMVLAFIEHLAGAPTMLSLEVLTMASRLARQMSRPLEAVAIGPNGLAAKGILSSYGVTALHVADDPRLAAYVPS